MFRSVAAVIAGYLIFAVTAAFLFAIAQQDPHAPASAAFMIVSIAYGTIFAILGGYVAGAIAVRRPVAHAAAVSIVLAAVALVSLMMRPGGSPVWSQVSALVLMAPSAFLGGLLRKRRSAH